MKNKEKRIFLDYASATPTDIRVLALVKRLEDVQFANPSALYDEGVQAKKLLDEFRKKCTNLIGVSSDELVFTGGGTEANVLAILGTHFFWKKEMRKPHIVVSAFEHPSVLEAAKRAEELGAEVSIVPVTNDGFVEPKEIFKALKSNTVLVSVMHANNEIGTIQPIKEIAREIRRFRSLKKKNSFLPYFHTDASHSPNYLDISPVRLGVDLASFDGSKIYGPKGVGALYKKRGVKIAPVIVGGGQEEGLRSGTENIAAIAGFTKALEIALLMREKESQRLTKLRDYAFKLITRKFSKVLVNGSLENRMPNNINVCFPGFDAEFAVIKLGELGILASSSSSCRTLKENADSYVIRALGRKQCVGSSLRFTLGRNTQKKDLDALIKAMSFLA